MSQKWDLLYCKQWIENYRETGFWANKKNYRGCSVSDNKCPCKTEIDYKKKGIYDDGQGKFVHGLPQQIRQIYSFNSSQIQNSKCDTDSETVSFGSKMKGLKPYNPKKTSCWWSVCL
ncbi:hypothetical protein TNCV_3669851 [Trichonephila clavipes]|nr:hypothetical protein TNCV_3669851 [Trichonephila clavipes]